MLALTAEQVRVVEHSPARHATVLAVAGSGKTTTMVHRIRHLITAHGVPARGIRAVMYNKSAQLDFAEKLRALGLREVGVQTLHSLGYGILGWAAQRGHIKTPRLLDRASERKTLQRVLGQLRSAGQLPEDRVFDIDEVGQAISIWKASLTPPGRARHLDGPGFVKIYHAFEQERARNALLTFDDQIYDAVNLLRNNQAIVDALSNRLEHLIVDEFQDVNLARLMLIKLVAGQRARVMVVGDDDQCIYEWQGARAAFIKRGFERYFPNHPHSRYTLSHSFRFGPTIAQLACNLISHNSDRVDKQLQSHFLVHPSVVELHTGEEDHAPTDALSQIQQLLDDGVAASEIVVLFRKHVQSHHLQGLLLARQIPFVVVGERPFFETTPVRLLRRYLTLLHHLFDPIDRQRAGDLKQLINRPNRRVRKQSFELIVDHACTSGTSAAQLLTDRARLSSASLTPMAIESILRLGKLLQETHGLHEDSANSGGEAAVKLVEQLDFLSHYTDTLGLPTAETFCSMQQAFATLLTTTRVRLEDIDQFVDGFDTTQGAAHHDCVHLQTIHRSKGLEWDHVLLPGLLDGWCPDLRTDPIRCLDRSSQARPPAPTHPIEAERRLLYVGLTRARFGLYLFADAAGNQPMSRFVHELCFDATRAAHTALESLLGGTDDPLAEVRCLWRAAQADQRLAQGLKRTLARALALADTPQIQANLERAARAVARTTPRSFNYPCAYPDPQTSQIQKPELGLPF